MLKLKEELGDVGWSSVIDEMDPNQSFDNFYNILTVKFDQFCLFRNLKGKRPTQGKQWLNASLLRSIYEKNRLYKIKMKYPTEINIIPFKNYKNLLVRILRENESVYYKHSFKNSDSPR